MAVRAVLILTLFIFRVQICQGQYSDFEITREYIQTSESNSIDSFSVFVVDPRYAKEVQPILGSLHSVSNMLRFSPLIPFKSGRSYFAQVNQEVVELIFFNTEKSHPELVSIYPSSNNWPANLLKFYLLFDRPMGYGLYQHIRLLDSSGKTVERAILSEMPELWNHDHTVLTVWIEPGRIKKELGPNVRLGPVLEENQSYIIEIDSLITDHKGIRLEREYQFQFDVTIPDTTSIHFSNWSVPPIEPNSWDPLRIQFHEVLDFGSVRDNLAISLDDKIVNGVFQFTNQESEILFVPEEKWLVGNYSLIISNQIEDLAGNRIDRLFDQRISSAEGLSTTVTQIEEDKKRYSIDFTIE